MVGFTITAGLSEFEDFALFCLFMLLPMKKQVVYIFIHGRSSFSPLILSVTLETDNEIFLPLNPQNGEQGIQMGKTRHTFKRREAFLMVRRMTLIGQLQKLHVFKISMISKSSNDLTEI